MGGTGIFIFNLFILGGFKMTPNDLRKIFAINIIFLDFLGNIFKNPINNFCQIFFSK